MVELLLVIARKIGYRVLVFQLIFLVRHLGFLRYQMRDRIFFLVSDHSFGYFQDDWVESERSPLKHAYLFVKVYQVRLVKFVFVDLV